MKRPPTGSLVLVKGMAANQSSSPVGLEDNEASGSPALGGSNRKSSKDRSRRSNSRRRRSSKGRRAGASPGDAVPPVPAITDAPTPVATETPPVPAPSPYGDDPNVVGDDEPVDLDFTT